MRSVAKIIVRNIQKERNNKEDIMILSDGKIDCPRITTQCCVLDRMLGGGMPLGRVIEIYGNEGSGKTTLALHICAAAQQAGGIAAIIDTEHALDPIYAKAIGVDWGETIFSQPNGGEEAMEIAKSIMLAKDRLLKDKPLVIVIDSAAALPTREELEGGIADTRISPVARLLSQTLRRLSGIIGNTNTLFIFTNQLRDKVMSWGNPSKSTGGRALKFYTSIRLELTSGSQLKKGNNAVGQIVKFRVAKNKTFPPFKKGEFHIRWGMGIDMAHSLFALGVEEKIIRKKGNWFQFGKFRYHGANVFIEKLRNDEVTYNAIESRLMSS